MLKQMIRFKHNYTAELRKKILTSRPEKPSLHRSYPARVWYDAKYTGTTVYLLDRNGNEVLQLTTRLHPSDSFCRRTGRHEAYRQLIDYLYQYVHQSNWHGDPLSMNKEHIMEVVALLTDNLDKAPPLNY